MLLTQDKKEFLIKCRYILKHIGVKGITGACGHDGDGACYEDELIYIGEITDGPYMEIERKRTQAPIMYIHDGKVILFHSDFVFLEEHVNALCKKIDMQIDELK